MRGQQDLIDERSDIYALAVVLYEAICGRVPFSADSQAATALARLHSTPPRPRQIRPTVPRALDDVIMRAIARDPSQRYPSAAEFRAALLQRDKQDSERTVAPLRAAPDAVVVDTTDLTVRQAVDALLALVRAIDTNRGSR